MEGLVARIDNNKENPCGRTADEDMKVISERAYVDILLQVEILRNTRVLSPTAKVI
jgi:hypothetical protein